MILRILIGVGVGVALGVLLGSTRSCETGGCPLTANPWRGGVYGGVIGLLLAFSLGNPKANSPEHVQPNLEGMFLKSLPDNTKQTVKTLDTANFASFIEKEVKLIEFWSPMYDPSKEQLPIINKINECAPEGISVGRVNISRYPGLGWRFHVEVVPTLIILREGKEVQRFGGVQTARTLLNALTNAKKKKPFSDN